MEDKIGTTVGTSDLVSGMLLLTSEWTTAVVTAVAAG